MIQTKPFFGSEGLTSTSANHYCNLAKEVSRQYQHYLMNVRFYTTEISIIGDDKKGVMNKGADKDDIATIRKSIENLADLNSLIAFFREAIKEKENIIKALQNWEDTSKTEPFEAKYNELKSQRPKCQEYITEEDVVRSWTIGEQEHYLSLEAEAAVYGKYIHEDGPISEFRIDLMKKLANPIEVKENGRDTIIYNFTSTVDLGTINEMYYELQAHHRGIQAELNGMKKKIQDAIDADKLDKDEEYRKAHSEWSAKMQAIERARIDMMNEIGAERKRLIAEANALKIVVPNRLKPILEELKKL